MYLKENQVSISSWPPTTEIIDRKGSSELNNAASYSVDIRLFMSFVISHSTGLIGMRLGGDLVSLQSLVPTAKSVRRERTLIEPISLPL
jgi:hypothetical protein